MIVYKRPAERHKTIVAALGAPPNRSFVHAYKRPVEMHKFQNACESALSNLIY